MSVLGWLLCAATSPCIAVELPTPTFHCSFDDGLRPEVCAAGTEAQVKGEVEFVEGREGKALLVPEKCSVAFPTERHINQREGTVALWVKPMPPEGRPKFARLFDMTADGDPATAIRLLHPNHTILYGNVSTGGKNYIPWPMGDASVRDEQWQHVAVTWGPGGATFYVNGVTLTTTAEMPELGELAELFYVASEKDDLYAACAPIDDLYIFDTALRSHELFQLAGRAPAHDLAAGNWLRNGSFELGTRPWQTFLWAAKDSTLAVTDEEARTGSHSFLMDRSAEDHEWWSTTWLVGPWLHLQRGEEVELSAWMKADRPGCQVRIDIQRGTEGRAVQGVPEEAELGQYYTVGAEWQRLALSGKLPISYKDGYRPRISLVTKPCKLWIDDVRMRLAGAPEDQPAQPEVGLASAEATAVYPLGAEANVWVYAEEPGARVAVSVTTPDGSVVLDETVTPTPAGPATVGPIKTEAPGHYLVTARAGQAEDRLTLAALRDHSPTPSPKSSPFGAHGGANDTARMVGLSQYRDVSGLTWRWIERQEGEWRYDERLETYARLVDLGFTNCGTVADAPPWASEADLVPSDMDEWRRYAERLITDFAPYVDIWEVWNEPDLKPTFQQHPEKYLEILKATREIQQQADPDSQLAGLCAAGVEKRAFEWMEEALKLGALDHMDLLAWHPYYHREPEGGYFEALQRVNELMDAHGGRKPMIFTEFGTSGVSDWSLHIPWAADGWRNYDEREQAAILVRQCVMGLAHGAVKLYWYQWAEERIQTGPDTFGLVRADTYATPKLAAVAYNQLVWQLEAAELPPKALDLPGDSQWGYEFAAPAGTVSVLWDTDGETSVSCPEGARAVDLWGNELPDSDDVKLSSEPVYVVSG